MTIGTEDVSASGASRVQACLCGHSAVSLARAAKDSYVAVTL